MSHSLALGKEAYLPSVLRLTLGKNFFTECHSLTLGKVYVGHLFSNVVNQEQDNTIVDYNRPSSLEVLSPQGYNTH
jgi:hypothetical protein